jgi:hypothetical protein
MEILGGSKVRASVRNVPRERTGADRARPRLQPRVVAA